MAQHRTPLQVNPGKGLGFLVLGASLHEILTRLKSQPNIYPTIDLSFSSTEPLATPVVVSLSHNGLRLRFDGPDQRLRLIEVLEFSRTAFTYKNLDVVKFHEHNQSLDTAVKGPAFRQVYHKLFGPTFSGEYLPPLDGSQSSAGTYVLSYPGVAFSFPLQNSAWSPEADFVSLLSSPAASPAKCLTIFNGSSWPDARQDLFTRPCPHPRSLSLSSRGREGSPDEIELVKVCGNGHVEMLRRFSPPFHLIFSETTPQDLVAELGPPDAIYRKVDRRLSIHKSRTRSRSDQHHPTTHSNSPTSFDGVSDTDQSSVRTSADDSDQEASASESRDSSTECFYNYFHHGFDVFVSHPSSSSPSLDPSHSPDESTPHLSSTNHLVATKLLLHANVPGSFPFNRYRRSRWVLDPEQITDAGKPVNSETSFSSLARVLRNVWEHSYSNKEEKYDPLKPMVLNRGWADSPGSSCELAGGSEESVDLSKKRAADLVAESESSLGNTNLFGFPGLLFEVLKNDAISCLTVY